MLPLDRCHLAFSVQIPWTPEGGLPLPTGKKSLEDAFFWKPPGEEQKKEQERGSRLCPGLTQPLLPQRTSRTCLELPPPLGLCSPSKGLGMRVTGQHSQEGPEMLGSLLHCP